MVEEVTLSFSSLHSDIWLLLAVISVEFGEQSFLIVCGRNQAFKDGTTQRRVVELVNATAERLGQVEMCPRTLELYNKAKEHGYEAIMNAGSAMVSKLTTTKDSQTKSVADWFTFGTAAAGKLLTVASDRGTNFFLCKYYENGSKR